MELLCSYLWWDGKVCGFRTKQQRNLGKRKRFQLARRATTEKDKRSEILGTQKEQKGDFFGGKGKVL